MTASSVARPARLRAWFWPRRRETRCWPSPSVSAGQSASSGHRQRSSSAVLARTDGVICPPESDPEIRVPTLDTGKTPVIPPPGSRAAIRRYGRSSPSVLIPDAARAAIRKSTNACCIPHLDVEDCKASSIRVRRTRIDPIRRDTIRRDLMPPRRASRTRRSPTSKRH